MKSRLIFLAVVVAAIAGFWFMTIRPAMVPTAPRLNRRALKDIKPPEFRPPPLPEPVIAMPTLVPPPLEALPSLPPVPRRAHSSDQRMEVPIQNGATIDFSIGAPVVRSQGDDQAALDKALKDMADAVKNISFDPPAQKAAGETEAKR